jgi:positive regulator of sigma E activity
MTIVKRVSLICSLVLTTAIGGFGIYEWVTKEIVNASTLFYIFLGIGFFFQSITWGEMEGKHEGKKDELEKYITLKSSKISYYLLLFLMLMVLAVSERVTAMNDIKNIPLVIVIGLAWITMPITEFFVSKKYS